MCFPPVLPPPQNYPPPRTPSSQRRQQEKQKPDARPQAGCTYQILYPEHIGFRPTATATAAGPHAAHFCQTPHSCWNVPSAGQVLPDILQLAPARVTAAFPRLQRCRYSRTCSHCTLAQVRNYYSCGVNMFLFRCYPPGLWFYPPPSLAAHTKRSYSVRLSSGFPMPVHQPQAAAPSTAASHDAILAGHLGQDNTQHLATTYLQLARTSQRCSKLRLTVAHAAALHSQSRWAPPTHLHPM